MGFKELIIKDLSDAEFFVHRNDQKKAMESVWKGLNLMNALEFKLFPSEKKTLMPARHAIEQFMHVIRDWKKKKVVYTPEPRPRWNELFKTYTKALNEIEARVKI